MISERFQDIGLHASDEAVGGGDGLASRNVAFDGVGRVAEPQAATSWRAVLHRSLALLVDRRRDRAIGRRAIAIGDDREPTLATFNQRWTQTGCVYTAASHIGDPS